MPRNLGALSFTGLALAIASPVAAQQADLMDDERLVRTVDECLAANVQTEFDTPADVLTRVKASCEISATIRFPARGHAIMGDILRYDPVAARFVWNVQLNEQNRFYGGGASPYRLTAQLDGSGRPGSPGSPPGTNEILREVGNTNFWLLPLVRLEGTTDTYQASNAYGASMDVQRVRETRYGIAARIPPRLSSLPVLEVPVDAAAARDVVGHLDILLTFRVGEVCRICYKANTLERGTRPTIRIPLDEEITTRFVYVEITEINVVDRRTGRIIPSTIPSAGQ